MRVTIEKLRTGVLVVAGTLLVAIAVFFLYARHLVRHKLNDLPAKLGVQIQSSANGFTYSQSHEGHTLFTLHASKAVQYKGGGRATLHDVSIMLYGPKGDHTDRIYGQDFEFDPATGIAQAQGEVQIDLNGPATQIQTSKSPAHSPTDAPDDKNTIHVKAHGMVFNRNTGLATTDGDVDFAFSQAAGHATGGSYDSQKGVLMLDKAVELSSSYNGEPLLVHSSNAQILRADRKAILQSATLDYQSERSSANRVNITFRDDGSAEHVQAVGDVHIRTDSGAELTSNTADMQLDQRSQPVKAHLTGGVSFESASDAQRMTGSAAEGLLDFGPRATLHHATLLKTVSFTDELRGLPDDPNGSAKRVVNTSQLDVEFATGQDRRTVPTRALAVGGATVAMRTVHSHAPEQNTTIQADRLLANFSNGSALSSVDGTGHTRLTDLAANGTTQTSTGDTLAIKFAATHKAARPKQSATLKPPAAVKSQEKKKSKSSTQPSTLSAGASEIESAVQQGNVVLTQTPAPGKAAANDTAPSGFKAIADRADYNGATQMLHLSGSPRITDGTLDLTAGAVDYARVSGDASAQGDVKATYLQIAKGQSVAFGGQGPVHIVAAQAHLIHASGDAVFTASAGEQARMWQGTNSIAAPVLELSRIRQTLKAHGATAASQPAVSAALLTSSGPKRQPGVVRINSQQLLYSDAERKAAFRGAVVADDGTGTIRSDQVDVYLVEAQAASGQKGGSAQAQGSAQSQVERMIATGHVVLQQPGRRGTGDTLVYTAKNGNFVLTGTGASPPTLSDQAHGTVTGDSLIFNSQDDSVTVSGGQSGAVTQTRTPR